MAAFEKFHYQTLEQLKAEIAALAAARRARQVIREEDAQ